MPGTRKDSPKESSTRVTDNLKRIVLIDPSRFLDDKLNKESLGKDSWLNDYQVIRLDKAEKLVELLSLGDAEILIAVDEKPEHVFAILELAQQLSPHTARILIANQWSEKSLRDAINRSHVFRALNFSISFADLKMHLQAAAVEADLARTQIRLMKEATRQNRDLENLTDSLEKIVEERTVHIRESKEEMDDKLDLVRQLIRFIKDLSRNISFEELMDLVRKDFKKFAKLGDPILVLRSQVDHALVFSFRSGVYRSSGPISISNHNFHFPTEIILNDKEISKELANIFGRPYIRVVTIPLQVKLIQKFGFSEAAALLCVESSMSETEQAPFLDHVMRILQPVSVAVDRSFLQRALSMQSYRWEKTFDGLRDPLSIVDIDYNVVHANKKFSDRIVQKKCYETFAYRSTPCDGCPMTLALSEGQTHVSQIKVGDRIYEVGSYPIQMSDSARTTTVVNQYVDVTQARQLYVRMLQSEKMSALGLLAGNIAHELNNPLSGIRSLAQIMINDSKDNEQVKNDLVEIEKAAKRSQSIIKNLLDFSSGVPQKLQLISLSEIVEKTLPFLKTALRSHRLHLELQKNELKIMMDPQLMQQVVFNLITNACQAMKEIGTLTISTNISKNKKYIELHISDTGLGIPKELQDKIFEPFFTTKQEGQGTGLGLSLSRDIIRKMGGDIFVHSELGQGSRFEVHLPISNPENL